MARGILTVKLTVSDECIPKRYHPGVSLSSILRPMPTVGERLATITELLRELDERVGRVEDALNGGGDVDYDRSVRGRLHKLETWMASIVLRKNMGVGLLKGWERAALVLFGAATAAAAWYQILSS